MLPNRCPQGLRQPAENCRAPGGGSGLLLALSSRQGYQGARQGTRSRRRFRASAPRHGLLPRGPTFLPVATGRRPATPHLRGTRMPPAPTAPPHAAPGRAGRRPRAELMERVLEFGKEVGSGGTPNTEGTRPGGDRGGGGQAAMPCVLPGHLRLAVALRRRTSPGALLPAGPEKPPRRPAPDAGLSHRRPDDPLVHSPSSARHQHTPARRPGPLPRSARTCSARTSGEAAGRRG